MKPDVNSMLLMKCILLVNVKKRERDEYIEKKKERRRRVREGERTTEIIEDSLLVVYSERIYLHYIL